MTAAKRLLGDGGADAVLHNASGPLVAAAHDVEVGRCLDVRLLAGHDAVPGVGDDEHITGDGSDGGDETRPAVTSQDVGTWSAALYASAAS